MMSRYIPSEEAVKFIAFIRAMGLEDNANAELHYRLADKLFSGDRRLLIESFRGSAKSSIGEYFLIYCAVLGNIPGSDIPFNFVVFVGDSMENGTKSFFRNMRSKIRGSDFLKPLLRIERDTDSELELVNADGHQTNFKGFGAAGNIRGVRYAAKNGKTYRPSCLFIDDVVTDTSASSDTIRESISNNFWKSLLPALDPNGMVIVIGTPQSEADLLHELKGQSSWAHHRFPICEEFPCEKSEFVGNWSDRFPYEKVLELYTMYKDAGKLNAFRQELFLEIIDVSNLLVEEDDIQWFDPSLVLKNKGGYNYYISTDFATSTKKSADFSVIGVWAISSNNDWLLVDGQCLRQTMQENIEDLFRYVKKWKPLSVGIESSGQQGGFLSIIEEMKMQRNIWFQFARKRGSKEPGIRPVKDKMHRFVTGVQPKFKQNKIWFPKPEMVKTSNYRLFGLVEEMVNELSKFTMAGGVTALKHDDCCTPDTLVTMGDWSRKRIDCITAGEEVMTYDIDSVKQQVEKVIMTGVKEVETYLFSDGSEISMTDNHPVLTTKGYIPAELLTKNDEVITCNKNLMGTNGQKRSQDTTKVLETFQMVKESGYTNIPGHKLMVNNLKDFTYIIKTEIKTITQSTISNVSQQVNTQNTTDFKETWKNKRNILKRLDHLRTNGTKQKNVKNGLGKILKSIEKKCLNTTTKNADGAKNLLKLDSLTGLPTATVHVNFKPYKQMLLDRKSMNVSGVETRLNGIDVKKDAVKNVALTYLLEKKDRRLSPTYNLEVTNTHNFIANGVVVHNCIDIINQLSEMELYAPSDEVELEKSVTGDGLVWTGIWDDDSDDEEYGGSTIF